jgi:hypothetical protein
MCRFFSPKIGAAEIYSNEAHLAIAAFIALLTYAVSISEVIEIPGAYGWSILREER